ncbi:MAG TPA: metalloregulator ArsR/SmtB family transcription factor [Vicinamibacterales bacterium]|nr:metalloregulator ArsR/SmtB family transcription factor [Vicinamibacterales bacterium]
MKKSLKIETTDDACEVNVVDARKIAAVRKKMHSARAVELLADTFRLLGDATRVKIVFALHHEELCVCDLATIVGASQSAVSHSLRALRQMGLVRYRKQGKIAYYSLDDEHIGRLIEEGFDHVRELV